MITNLDIERYTCGDCHYLARALHKLTGWPMAAFVDRWGDPDRHAFVLTPDGDVFDVHGIESPHDARRRWRAPRRRIQTFEWPDLLAFGEPEFGPYSVRRARIVARQLVAEHLDPTTIWFDDFSQV
jgi:hypothetical protein